MLLIHEILLDYIIGKVSIEQRVDIEQAMKHLSTNDVLLLHVYLYGYSLLDLEKIYKRDVKEDIRRILAFIEEKTHYTDESFIRRQESQHSKQKIEHLKEYMQRHDIFEGIAK